MKKLILTISMIFLFNTPVNAFMSGVKPDLDGGAALVVIDGVIHKGPPGANVTAGYGVFKNNTDKDISLTTFRSPVYDNLEVHGMEYTSDGTAKMKNVPILTIPANGEAILGKGGLHLMFMGNRRDIQLGEEILVVTFDTDEVRYMLNFKVIDPRESVKHDHSHDHHMH